MFIMSSFHVTNQGNEGKPVRDSRWITACLPYTGQVSLSLEPLCQCQEHTPASCWHRKRDLWSDCCLHRLWINAPLFSPQSSSLSSEVFGTSAHQASMRLSWANWPPVLTFPIAYGDFYCLHTATSVTSCLSTLWVPKSCGHLYSSVFSPVFLCFCGFKAFTKKSIHSYFRWGENKYILQFPMFNPPIFTESLNISL